MPDVRKKPCSICHCWFRPDPRVGLRQQACKKPDCQAARRKKKQKEWRKQHPDYFTAQRIRDRTEQCRIPEPLELPPPLNQLPWDIAQDEFGAKGADFIGVMGALLLRAAQSQFKAYVPEDSKDTDILRGKPAQSQIPPVREWVRVEKEAGAAGYDRKGVRREVRRQ
jgi:hypothetical protein